MEHIHEGQVIIITGAAQGIGLTIAKYLSERGAIVVIADINEQAAKQAAENLPNQLGQAVFCDVTSQESTIKMVSQIMEKFGRIDVLINNAGYFPRKAFFRNEFC
jgi:NAD(P)-dependent dehydrogenase (short-subunit alcohol dehydrogenase family)